MEDGWLNEPFSLVGKRVWVAGHRGMVGAAMLRRLQSEKCKILTSDFDLRAQADVKKWMDAHKPQVIVLAAAKVGGIQANMDAPADFLTDNLQIQTNVIQAAHEAKVEKLLFLGSSCIYPKNAPQPIREEALLTGALEATNESYAIAKTAGIKMCEAYRRQYGDDFISVMPCNLYGPGDRFDEGRSHVIPALVMKVHEAKMAGGILNVWGGGKAWREFLYVDDLADALLFALKNYSSGMPLNIGSGTEITIAALAGEIAEVVGFAGKIIFDDTKPEGVNSKLMDSSRIFEAGWKPQTILKRGLRQTYEWFLSRGLRDAA